MKATQGGGGSGPPPFLANIICEQHLTIFLVEVNVWFQYTTLSITKNHNIEIKPSSIARLNGNYFPVQVQLCWAYTGPNRNWIHRGLYIPSIVMSIQKNIAPAARAIWRINSSNIALPGRTIMELEPLEIVSFCIKTHVNIAGALWKSFVLRLYFTVYPSFSHNTDTLCWNCGVSKVKSCSCATSRL